jgi:hypothetical protein
MRTLVKDTEQANLYSVREGPDDGLGCDGRVEQTTAKVHVGSEEGNWGGSITPCELGQLNRSEESIGGT